MHKNLSLIPSVYMKKLGEHDAHMRPHHIKYALLARKTVEVHTCDPRSCIEGLSLAYVLRPSLKRKKKFQRVQ